jgi:hypothetical protein
MVERVQFGADGKIVEPQGAPQGEPNAQPQAPQKPARPDYVPEQFWNGEKGEVNVEALLKSQRDGLAEINRLRNASQQKPQAPQQPQQQAPQGDQPPQKPQGQPQGQPQAQPQVDIKAVQQEAAMEFAQSGQLSDATYEKLAKVGFDRDTVDAYVEGRKAKANAQQQKLFDAAKVSREEFTEASEWARKNLSQDEITALNARLVDPITAASAVAEVRAKFVSQANKDGNLVNGNPGTPSGEHYKSKEEMKAVISSEGYKKGDRAVHAKHQAMLLASEKAGVNLYL